MATGCERRAARALGEDRKLLFDGPDRRNQLFDVPLNPSCHAEADARFSD